MQRLKVLGLVLVAVFAIGAITVASASAALPEFAKTAVKFKTKGGTGELKAGTQIVQCASSESKEAEVTGVKAVAKVVVKFKGCEKAGAGECKSTGAAAKEIVTTALSGEIGYLNATEKTVGSSLKPTVGTEFVKFKCGSELETTVTGCVMAHLTGTFNAEVEQYKLAYREVAGKQEFRGFEGATNCELTAFGFIGAVEVTETTLETEPVGAKEEIKA
jgi:hypothetical protein